MESERDGPRVAPEPTMRSDLEEMPELSDTMMAPEEESDDVINVPEVCQRALEGFRFRWQKIKGNYAAFLLCRKSNELKKISESIWNENCRNEIVLRVLNQEVWPNDFVLLNLTLEIRLIGVRVLVSASVVREMTLEFCIIHFIDQKY